MSEMRLAEEGVVVDKQSRKDGRRRSVSWRLAPTVPSHPLSLTWQRDMHFGLSVAKRA